MAKLLEKIVADRMTKRDRGTGVAVMEPNWGTGKRRSTLSAIDLLTACVETAWKTWPGCVVSMLSLDIKWGLPQCISREAPLGPPGEGLPAVDCMFCAQLPAGQAHKSRLQWIRK